MDPLNFSTNWNNKLGCHFFTSMRLSGRYNIGDEVEITMRERLVKKAIVRGKRVFRMNKINEFIAGLDTGYSVAETCNLMRKFYPEADWNTQEITMYLFETIKN
ncbi:MAG: hypothetical protein UT21_C0006G0035 [Candidatus Woesebacteria bacterium GW2011_GWA1_39_11b]|nr:MAG: hypothetical protein UT21_C0006G0035 [Candidatus Woesebacteria bacterium GW2011_GWA1_39_11b]KKS77113.1 MAG: hypothetical protein UV51_C0010G0018 [Candidatus Woesebacteria bacterium GW2011_GWC1_42_9]